MNKMGIHVGIQWDLGAVGYGFVVWVCLKIAKTQSSNGLSPCLLSFPINTWQGWRNPSFLDIEKLRGKPWCVGVPKFETCYDLTRH